MMSEGKTHYGASPEPYSYRWIRPEISEEFQRHIDRAKADIRVAITTHDGVAVRSIPLDEESSLGEMARFMTVLWMGELIRKEAAKIGALKGEACPRCGQGPGERVQSRFDLENICPECHDAERTHPAYAEAVEAVLAARESGDSRFTGIGLPEDLKAEAEARSKARQGTG